jgi:hypothetical protein
MHQVWPPQRLIDHTIFINQLASSSDFHQAMDVLMDIPEADP